MSFIWQFQCITANAGTEIRNGYHMLARITRTNVSRLFGAALYLLFTEGHFKTAQVFFFDNADEVDDEGARFENLVATHLLKRRHFIDITIGSIKTSSLFICEP
ncbi:MAG: hypothetical protein JRJ41_02755 [Deltaproteobacteria bacterium]|nr:hypothetical protein [Deltaproteobacteria bacterium]